MAKKKVSRQPASDSNLFRILSLDGGGIRGIIPAKWLEVLEESTGKAASNSFDLIAGTSTGSILACGVALGIPAKKIIDLYIDRGSEIFSRGGFLSRAGRLFTEGISGPKYSDAGLETELKEVFKDKAFGDLPKKVLITTYNTEARQPMIFKSWRKEYEDFPIWEIVKASCSAPTYFPGHALDQGRYSVPLIDGGVVANNPAACALAEGVRLRKDDGNSFQLSDFKLLSLGTGELTQPITLEEVKEWGALEWAIPLIDVLFDGSSDAVHYQCTQVLGDTYLRIQCALRSGIDKLDNPELTNLQALLRTANKRLNEGALRDMNEFLE